MSYNQFDFGPIFKHGKKAREEKEKRREAIPSFMKQMIYFILFIVLNLGYVLSFNNHFTLINLHRLSLFIKLNKVNFCHF